MIALARNTSAVRAELAPHGKLRLAFPVASALYVTKDAATGALRGLSMDIGAELARRLGVPFEPLPCATVRDLIDATAADTWDVATIVKEAERETIFDYSRVYLEADSTYLVPAGSAIVTIADVDRPGTRIAVAEKSAFDLFLSRNLKEATLTRHAGVGAALEAMRAGNAEAVAAPRQVLMAAQPRFPRARILDGWFDVAHIGVVVPKGTRAAGLAYINEFLNEAIASGWIAEAMQRTGLKGTKVPPG